MSDGLRGTEDGLTVSTEEAGGGEDGSNEGEGKTHRVWAGRGGAGSEKHVDEERGSAEQKETEWGTSRTHLRLYIRIVF